MGFLISTTKQIFTKLDVQHDQAELLDHLIDDQAGLFDHLIDELGPKIKWAKIWDAGPVHSGGHQPWAPLPL